MLVIMLLLYYRLHEKVQIYCAAKNTGGPSYMELE